MANFVVRPHAWKPLRNMGREWCFRCGLVRLHNPLTTWCVQHGCDYDEHPQYRQIVRRLTTEGSPAFVGREG